MMSNARRILAIVLANLLLFPLTPQTARAQTAMASSTESYAAPDVTSSSLSSAAATTATAATKAPEIPVSAQGNYQTSIPIVVPPGRAGMQPSLALRYDSGASKRVSAVGAGWSLDVSSVSRSLTDGYPRLKRTSSGLKYEELANLGAAFSVDGLDLAIIPPSGNDLPDPVLPSSVFFAGQRAMDATVMEYSATKRGWIAHLPNGTKRAYGYDPVTSKEAHVKNELGVFKWLLLREWDINGNRIVYDYHNLQTDPLPSMPLSPEPFLKKVSWGGNDEKVTADFFSVETILGASNLVETDMLNGSIRVAPQVTNTIAVCAPQQTMQRASGTTVVGALRSSAPCVGSTLVRRLDLAYVTSVDTGRLLLDNVIETIAAVSDPITHTFDYSSNGGKLAFGDLQPLVSAPSDSADNLLLTREARGPGTPPIGAATYSLAVAPPMTSIGARLMDFNSDGRSDIVYHPSGIRSPNAPVLRSATPVQALPPDDPTDPLAPPREHFPYDGVVPRSGLRSSTGTYDEIGTSDGNGFGNGFGAGIGMQRGRRYTDFADMDGDGRVDGVFFNQGPDVEELRISMDSTKCFSQDFWNKCGVIDPYVETGLDICDVSNQCEEHHPFDFNFCSAGLCWIDESLFVDAFADVEDWDSTPPTSPAGLALLDLHGFEITSQLDRIGVDGAELRARLGIDGDDIDIDLDDPAMWKQFFATSGAGLSEICDGLMEKCRGWRNDGFPSVAIDVQFERSFVLQCDHPGGSDWPDLQSRCHFVQTINAQMLAPKMMMGVHFNGEVANNDPPRIPLYGWPAHVGKASQINTPVVINGQRLPPWEANIERDFSAPIVDINADGQADVVLTRAMWATDSGTFFRFTPRAYVTGPPINPNGTPIGLRLDWEKMADTAEEAEEAFAISDFTESMNDILVGEVDFGSCLYGDCDEQPQNKYLIGAAYNAFVMDVNADGLPDLVAGRHDAVTAFYDDWRRANFNSNPGHDVHINRGYRFGDTGPHATLSSGPWVDILKGDLTKQMLDLNISIPTTSGRAPASASAFADLNADGRADVVVWYRNMLSSEFTLKLWLNQGDAYSEKTDASASNYLDNIKSGGSIVSAGNRFKNLGLRIADVQPDRTTMADQAKRFRAIAGADYVRFEDVNDDGLVDLLVPGVVCGVPPPMTVNPLPCLEIQVATPAQWSQLVRENRTLNYVPARVMLNQSVHPDLLVASERDDGVHASIAYGVARNDNNLVADDLYVPGGKVVVDTVTTGLTFDGDETVTQLSYGQWMRAESTSVSLGFNWVEGRRLRSFAGVLDDEALVGRRFFSDDATDNYAHRGLVVGEQTLGGGERHITENKFVTVSPWFGSKAKRIDREWSTTMSCASLDGEDCDDDKFYVTTKVTQRSPYGAALVEVTGDGDYTSVLTDTVTTERTVEDRTGPWLLGLTTNEVTRGRRFSLDGTSVANAELSNTDFDYDVVGRLVYRKDFDVVPQQCDSFEGTYARVFTVDDYDDYGNPTKTTTNGRVAVVNYDTRHLYPAQTTINVERYLDGSVTGSTALTSKRWTDIRTGAVWSTQDPNGAVSETQRDGLGRPSLVFDALGREVAGFLYGDDGLPGVASDDNSLATTTAYTFTSTGTTRTAKETITVTDGAGNVVRSYIHDIQFTSGGSTRTNGQRVEFHERDSDGRDRLSYLPALTTSAPAPTAPRARFTYDALGRVLTETAADVSRVTTYAYAPRFQEVTDPAGVTTTTLTDRRGEPVVVQRSAGALVATTQWQRDALGRLVSLTDADGNIQRFEHDGGGNLFKWTLPHAPSVAASGTFTKCHDVDGRVVSAIDADGREVAASYDAIGRPVIVEVDGDYSGVQTYTMSYDATGSGARLGRMWKSTDAVGATETSFDLNGRPTSTLRSFTTMAGINRIKSTPTWGLQGELKTLNVTGGVGTTVTTPLGAISVSYSPRGRLTTLTDGTTQLLGNIVYDAFGQASSFGVGAIPTPSTERVTASFTRNPLTRDVELITYARPSLTLAQLKFDDYGLDGSPGRELRTSALNATGTTAEVEKFWGYDAFRRLSSANIIRNAVTLQNVGYSYSAGGRLLSVAGTSPAIYTYGEPSLPGAATQVGSRQLTYDQSGSLHTDTRTSAEAFFAANGCLEAMKSSKGPALLQRCDVNGNAIYRETTGGGPILLLGMSELRGNDGTLVHRLPLDGLVTMELAYKTTTGARLAAESRIVMADTRGSVVAAAPLLGTSTLATPSASQDFDAWGAPISIGSAGAPKHGFVDHEADNAFGTYAFGRRVYDPTLRRWLSADPLISSNPVIDVVGGRQLDYWSYSGQNPILFTDRRGTCADGMNCMERQAEAAQKMSAGEKLAAVAVGVGAAIAGFAVALGLSAAAPYALEAAAQPALSEVAIGLLEGEAGFVVPIATGATVATKFKHGELYETIVDTAEGQVGMVAEVFIDGANLTLKDIAIYAVESGEPLSGLSREMIRAKTQLIKDAIADGFDTLRIVAERAEHSTSAKPGKLIDRTIDLTKEKR